MEDIIWLKPIPLINNMSFEEGGEGLLYKHPCLMYMGKEVNQLVDSLDNQKKASPGKYYVKDTEEVETVRLYVDKCPDGWEQNVRQSKCELRRGVDGEALCKRIDPLTRKSKIDLLKEHIQRTLQGEKQ